MGAPEHVLEKIRTLPTSAGVYIFRGEAEKILYIGKAKNLRSRVRSYFQEHGSDQRFFIPILQTQLLRLDTIVTGSEKEAAILENNLIKEHHPRFNVKLRDDKEYLSLRLDRGRPWPALELVRRADESSSVSRGPVPSSGVRYFGPYDSATAARRTLHLVNKHFQLRTCSDAEFARRTRPCLQYQIKRCPGPCVLEVDATWYGDQVRAVELFLSGRHDELSRELEEKMRRSAEATDYELAAAYRDQLRAIKKVRQGQRVLTHDGADRDVVGCYREGKLVEIVLLLVRAGRLADVRSFSLSDVEVDTSEVIAAFVRERYGTSAEALDACPGEVLLPMGFEGKGGAEAWIRERTRSKLHLLVPERGPKVALVGLAHENAKHAFFDKRRQHAETGSLLAELQEVLRLPELPRTIECCDISHLGGADTVGAVVAMRDGELEKSGYRTYRVRGRERETAGVPLQAGDDYGAMYEVLARRFRRGRDATRRESVDGDAGGGEQASGEKGRQTEWELPQLFVVDGGRGQLAVAMAAAQDLGLFGLPICALAKEKENVLGEKLVDRIYLSGQKNPIAVRAHPSLSLLARLRDEAHRFSNRGRKATGTRRRLRSRLDDIPGIGEKTRRKLLAEVGGLDEIHARSNEELRALGLTARQIARLRLATR